MLERGSYAVSDAASGEAAVSLLKGGLMVTTESQQAKRMVAKTAGATGWLVKPVHPDALLQVTKQVVRGT